MQEMITTGIGCENLATFQTKVKVHPDGCWNQFVADPRGPQSIWDNCGNGADGHWTPKSSITVLG